MKRILFLLLLTVSVYGQNPSRFAKIQITGNSNSGTATKVNVQEANGEVNTQTINTGFNKNIGLGGSDVVGANTLLNQYSTTPIEWTATAFNSGQVVFYAGKQWIAKIATVAGDVPSVSSKWEEITFDALANKTTTVDQTIIDGSTNAVSGNAVFDGLALKNELIAHLKFNNADKTIWNNGYSNVTTATSYGEGAGRLASGSNWTANGFQAGYSNTTGYNWTANGFQAGYSNTSGSNWTANGFRAGAYLANGTSLLLKLNDGVFIGANTKALEDNSINEIVIGYNATGLGSNSSVIGNSSTLRSRIWGRFLSGTSVDDGVNQLQVAGTISASPATTANQVPTWGQVFDGLALKSNIGHTHVASQITDLSKASVGLGNVDNTSDLSKPLSTATINALATKAPISSVHNPVTLGTANGLSLSNQQLSLGLASSGVTGALSGTDWNTFNGKFNTPIGLTTNYLPKWNGSGFGNSTWQEFAGGRLSNTGNDDLINQLQVNGSGFFNSNLNIKGSFTSIDTGVAGGNTAFRIEGFSNPTSSVYETRISFSPWNYNGSSFAFREALSLNSNLTATFSSSVTATSFIKSGGTSSQFLKADGSSDSSVYAPLASPTLTGTPTAPTAPAGTNTTQIATTAFVQAATRPYKVYTALLTQTLTNAPVATVLENTLGGSISFSRVSTGIYRISLTGAFTLNKTWFSYTRGITNNALNVTNAIRRVDNDTIEFNSVVNGSVFDGQTTNDTIEIRVYL